MREWMAWPRHCLIPLPEGLTAADGAMLEPLGVALHTVDLGHVRPGKSVGVFGSGPIGLFILQAARIAGAATLFATDLASRPHRLEAARALGARVFPADGNEARAIANAAPPFGLDVAIEAAGVQAAVDAAVEAVRPGGRVILAGIPSDERTSFPASTARRKGLTISLVRRMKHTYPRAIALAKAGLRRPALDRDAPLPARRGGTGLRSRRAARGAEGDRRAVGGRRTCRCTRAAGHGCCCPSEPRC